jgi:hypothetical protein
MYCPATLRTFVVAGVSSCLRRLLETDTDDVVGSQSMQSSLAYAVAYGAVATMFADSHGGVRARISTSLSLLRFGIKRQRSRDCMSGIIR